MPERVRAELEKDERIASVDVKATVGGSPGSYSVILAITVTPLEGPDFPLKLAISDVTVEVLVKGSL
jgi:hypothetical protein